MKTELTQLAKKHGFHAKLIYNDVTKYSANEDARYFLWLCSLQKWLREIHDIHIEIRLGIKLNNNYRSETFKPHGTLKSHIFISNPLDTYEEALEQGLHEALKLIKI